ncbi:hypothetical protein CIB93_08010 [Streptomyces sp. WZ.A104]|nr:hypothetical protein CIB93_08010 [Streptomyces sp. WZ.A104]
MRDRHAPSPAPAGRNGRAPSEGCRADCGDGRPPPLAPAERSAACLRGDAVRAGRHDAQDLKRVWHLPARFGRSPAPVVAEA